MKYFLLLVLALTSCGAPAEEPATAAPGCGLSTTWQDDESCIADAGIHFGPIDYDDPKATAPFVMAPGSDATFTVDAPIGDAVGKYVQSYRARARAGNHHLTLLVRRAGTPDFAYRPYTTTLPGENFIPLRHDGSPVSFSHSPEYEGAAIVVPANTVSWVFDIHYLNTTTSPILMEGWVALDVTDSPAVVLSYLQGNGGTQMSVAPYSRAVVTAGGPTCTLPADVALVTVGAHQHTHGRGFSLSVNGELVYKNTDWEHPYGAVFASDTTNPPLTGASGARSGVVKIPKGTPITWTCDIDNDLATPIRYGSNLKTAEMCAFGALFSPPLPNRTSWSCVTP